MSQKYLGEDWKEIIEVIGVKMEDNKEDDDGDHEVNKKDKNIIEKIWTQKMKKTSLVKKTTFGPFYQNTPELWRALE